MAEDKAESQKQAAVKYKPEFSRAKRRRLGWFSAVCVLTIFAALSFFCDDAVRNWIVQHQNLAARSFMNAASRFGDWPEHVALGLILFAFAAWKSNAKWRRILLAMLVACALAGLAARVGKVATGRARPAVQTETGWSGLRFDSKHHAFPSGHVAASAAFFATLALASWRVGIWFLWIPLLIALSRMYVAAHYFSDVICAAVLGFFCAMLVGNAMKLREK